MVRHLRDTNLMYYVPFVQHRRRVGHVFNIHASVRSFNARSYLNLVQPLRNLAYNKAGLHDHARTGTTSENTPSAELLQSTCRRRTGTEFPGEPVCTEAGIGDDTP